MRVADLDIPRVIELLLPQSRMWLVQRGYLEQDEGTLQVTPAGYRYFASIVRRLEHGQQVGR